MVYNILSRVRMPFTFQVAYLVSWIIAYNPRRVICDVYFVLSWILKVCGHLLFIWYYKILHSVQNVGQNKCLIVPILEGGIRWEEWTLDPLSYHLMRLSCLPYSTPWKGSFLWRDLQNIIHGRVVSSTSEPNAQYPINFRDILPTPHHITFQYILFGAFVYEVILLPMLPLLLANQNYDAERMRNPKTSS